MATQTYPKVSAKSWNVLRARVATAPSTKLTPTFVASILGMANPASARDNIVGPLRRLGLVEEDGGLTARGAKWRIDAQYDQACKEILDEIYPDDLKSLVGPDGSMRKSEITSWFSHQGLGESNARQMAATFMIIAEKKLPEPGDVEPKKKPSRITAKPRKNLAAVAKADLPEPGSTAIATFDVDDSVSQRPSTGVAKAAPNVHIDIQIHIPAAATADQIDQIFASMAKHLYQ